jgi:hypothetical protein
MRVEPTLTGPVLEYTPWLSGVPVRPGLYIASAERNDEMRSYWSGNAWSAQVDEAASDAAHEAARATPMDPARARSIEFRGLTRASHAWLSAELAGG